MTPSRNSANLLRSLATGAMLNAAAVAPALAASSFALPFDATAAPVRNILLWGSVALLIVALAAKVIQDRARRETLPQTPDLRWWKNPPPDPQH
jgi:hypothetical protein